MECIRRKKSMPSLKSAAGIAVFAALAAPVWAADWPQDTTKTTDVVLGADESPLASGDIVIPDSGAQARSLTLKQPYGAVQTVKGGPLAFGADAAVDPGDGDLVFSVPVTAEGGLEIRHDDRIYSYEISLPKNAADKVEVLTGVDLADLGAMPAKTEGDSMHGQTFVAAVEKRGEGWLEVQYQLLASTSSYLKMVKVRYEQTSPADPVTAYVICGKYLHRTSCGHPVILGVDTDLEAFERGKPGVNFYLDNDYGIASASFYGRERPTITFNGAPETGGTLTCPRTVKAEFNFRKGDPDVFTNAISLAGDTVFRTAMPSLTFRPESVALDHEFNRTEISFEAVEGAEDDELTRTYAFEGDDFFPKSWTLVFPNQLLSNLTGISDAVMGGASATGAASVPRFYRNDGLKGSFQICMDVQYAGGASNLHKMVLVELRQGHGGIEMRSDKTGYIRAAASDYPDGYDVQTHGWDPVTQLTPSINDYNAKSATFMFTRAPRVLKPEYKTVLADGNTFCGKSFSLVSSSDTMLWCEAQSDWSHFAVSTHGCVFDVKEGSVLTTPTDKELYTGSSEIYLRPGSVFLPGRQGVRCQTKHTVDHSMIILGSWAGDDRYGAGTDSQTYIGKLELIGGRIAGAPARFGIGGTAETLLAVTGDEPSVVDTGFQLYSARETSSEVTVSVSDVTADEAADLVLGGGLLNPIQASHVPLYGFSTFVKAGEGTMRIDGICNYTNTVDIREGTVEFTADGGAGEEGKYRLSGGSLAFAAGTRNTVKSLHVGGEGGGIFLAEGAEFAVSDASGLTAEGILNVTRAEGGRFRIGSRVFPGQLSMIRVNGRHVLQGADGCLELVGFVFSLR